MSDYCKQCAVQYLGEDTGDLKGLITPDMAGRGYVMPCICEGCGPTYVDDQGKCVAMDCIHAHGKQEPL